MITAVKTKLKDILCLVIKSFFFIHDEQIKEWEGKSFRNFMKQEPYHLSITILQNK